MKSASFLLTENCNLNCKYCFELEGRNKNRMSWEVAKAGIDFLRQSGDGYQIMMFGGEPFLEFELMKKMVDYAKSQPEMFSVQIITNATIINEEIAAWLKENKNLLTVQLSIDGYKEIHNSNRVFHDGSGSFDTVIKNMSLWKESLGVEDGRLNVHGVLSPETIGKVYDIYKFYRDTLGINYTWMIPAHSSEWTDKETEDYKTGLFEIAEDILREYKETGDKSVFRFNRPIDRVCSREHGHGKPCGAGDSFCTITADGSIWPCHEFYFNDPEKDLKIGDVYNGVDMDKSRIYREYGHEDLCSADCPNTDCSRCIADNYRVNGSIFEQIKGQHCKRADVESQIIAYMRDKTRGMFAEHRNDTGCGSCGDKVNHIDSDSLVKYLYTLEKRIAELEKQVKENA